jgi:hypothetical protein
VQQTTLLFWFRGRVGGGGGNKLKVVGGEYIGWVVVVLLPGLRQKCLVDYTNTQGARNRGDETP